MVTALYTANLATVVYCVKEKETVAQMCTNKPIDSVDVGFPMHSGLYIFV